MITRIVNSNRQLGGARNRDDGATRIKGGYDNLLLREYRCSQSKKKAQKSYEFFHQFVFVGRGLVMLTGVQLVTVPEVVGTQGMTTC